MNHNTRYFTIVRTLIRFLLQGMNALPRVGTAIGNYVVDLAFMARKGLFRDVPVEQDLIVQYMASVE